MEKSKEKSMYLIMMEKLIEYKPTINPKLMTLIFQEIEIIKKKHKTEVVEKDKLIEKWKNGYLEMRPDFELLIMERDNLKQTQLHKSDFYEVKHSCDLPDGGRVWIHGHMLDESWRDGNTIVEDEPHKYNRLED